jgi:hypothetical protein
MPEPDERYAGKVGRHPHPLSVVPGGVGTPIPTCPSTIKDKARWKRLWTVGRAWLSNEAHFDQMRMLCEAMEDRDRVRKAMYELHGTGRPKEQTMVTGSGGQRQSHPAFRQLDASESKIFSLMETLGFNPPKQRTKATPAKERSGLDALREKAATRGSGG